MRHSGNRLFPWTVGRRGRRIGSLTLRECTNLEEFEADGTAGHIESLTSRLYDPQARQWNQLWATSNDGTLGQPMIGDFKNGHGKFYDQGTTERQSNLYALGPVFHRPKYVPWNNRSRTMEARLGK